MNEQRQMSESFRTAIALVLTGGFLETYTFLLHGHVFANAQTGNIALCGISVASGRWLEAVRYAVPILSFSAGVAGVEWVREHWTLARIHWRQLVVLVEAMLLCGCFFLKGNLQDMLANLLVSVACALQVQAFRKVRGSSYASTMCTGNLRSATIAWLSWRKTRLPDARRQAFQYIGVIVVFLIGAAIAVPIVRTWEEPSIAVPIGLLAASAIMMSFRYSRPIRDREFPSFTGTAKFGIITTENRLGDLDEEKFYCGAFAADGAFCGHLVRRGAL